MIERRFVPAERMRLAVTRKEGESPQIHGLAAVYYDAADPGTEYELWSDVFERIMPGAFDEVVKTDDTRALFNHSADNLLGRVSAKTLDLRLAKEGLDYTITPPDTELGRSVTTLVERKDLQGSSFAFSVGEERWILDKDSGIEIREIVRISRLYDVGPVTFPAYDSTTTGIRAEGDLGEVELSHKLWKDERRTRKLAVESKLRRARFIEIQSGGF